MNSPNYGLAGRPLIWRAIEDLARDAETVGLTDGEIAALFLQAATDHAVSVDGPNGAAAWLSRLADALSEYPREYRGAGYRWLHKLPARLEFGIADSRGDKPLSTVRSLISAENLRCLLEDER
jgi:hypothetical protein